MEELGGEDKKIFDAETANDDDFQPDPDEQLMLDQGNGRVWLVKIPKPLLERWASIDVEDVHLATLRVFHNEVAPNGKKPRIFLFLPPYVEPGSTPPPEPQNSNRPIFNASAIPATENEPDVYELDMINETVENQIVVAERPKDGSFNLGTSKVQSTRARTTILTGRIKHDCSLRSMLTTKYRKKMRERTKQYNTPQRSIKYINEANIPGGQGGIKRLSAGVGMASNGAFSSLVKTKPKPAKGQFERMARIPRNQLLDHIFQLYRDQAFWGIRPLREKTQQPEAYLKEVLSEVAFLHRSGEYNGLWELKDNFKDLSGKGEFVLPDFPPAGEDSKMGLIDEEEEDEDEDMEEVS